MFLVGNDFCRVVEETNQLLPNTKNLLKVGAVVLSNVTPIY